MNQDKAMAKLRNDIRLTACGLRSRILPHASAGPCVGALSSYGKV